MICTRCGTHEATYHYRSEINGYTTEEHLCNACASTMDDNIFGMQGLSMVEEFFRRPAIGQSFGSRLFANPMHMGTQPMQHMAPTAVLPQKASEPHIPDAAETALVRRRQINQLRNALNHAVKSEQFEEAARLRDELYHLETEGG